MIISLTGASGSIGKVVLDKILQYKEIVLKILLRNSQKNQKFAKKLKNEYKDKIQIVYGDVTNLNDCENIAKDSDYLIHLAAIVSPQADHNPDAAIKINEKGTQNIIQGILNSGNRSKLVFLSSVAVYGNRNKKHYWGRVGDPVASRAF